MRTRTSQRISSASPPPPLILLPSIPMGLLTMPGTLSMSLGWLQDPVPQHLAASLTMPIPLSDLAPGWGRTPQTSQTMNKDDEKYGKKPYVSTSQPETLLSSSTMMMPSNKRSVGSIVSHSQYIANLRTNIWRRSHKEEKPASTMSRTKTASEKWRETNWPGPMSQTGMDSAQRSPAYSCQYEQTPPSPPPSSENPVHHEAEPLNIRLTVLEPGGATTLQSHSTPLLSEPPASTPPSGVMSLSSDTTDFEPLEMPTSLPMHSEDFLEVESLDNLLMMTTNRTSISITSKWRQQEQLAETNMTPISAVNLLLPMIIHQILQLLGQAPSQGSGTMIQLGEAESFYDLPTNFLLEETEKEETESSDPPCPGGVLGYGLLESMDEEELEQKIKRVRMQEYQEYYLQEVNFL
ncbi:uncharacterized protein BT62DRAFT_924538 [Guyanagaster necrorhizus]|uniref:Uncharacterized protein n=1 Tax=Guyanagaster necrorhizus TaxID=856835 RepID=A0A9P8ALE6_9AGAR|nr:uncharacterized protein BT62DRAFT_924538 [Guyanagaster necrorhizus MCA 3950]KAG7439715.1 hypothetical protein BT62DRAFT_924538 [Guyanagaster necrorhizus MCA 3950]